MHPRFSGPLDGRDRSSGRIAPARYRLKQPARLQPAYETYPVSQVLRVCQVARAVGVRTDRLRLLGRLRRPAGLRSAPDRLRLEVKDQSTHHTGRSPAP